VTWSYYRTDITPAAMTDESLVNLAFTAAVNALPPLFNDSVSDDWMQLIDTYGTDIPVSVVWGGQVTMDNFIHSCVYATKGASWITTQVVKDLALAMSAVSFSSRSQFLDAVYVQYSRLRFEIVPVVSQVSGSQWMNNLNITDWLQKLPANVMPIQQQFVTLSQFITDPARKAAFDQARLAYFAAANAPYPKPLRTHFPNQPNVDTQAGHVPCSDTQIPSTCTGQSTCPGATCYYTVTQTQTVKGRKKGHANHCNSKRFPCSSTSLPPLVYSTCAPQSHHTCHHCNRAALSAVTDTN